MADQPAAGETPRSSRMPDSTAESQGNATENDTAAPSASEASETNAPTFQAINSQAVAENANESVTPGAQGSDSSDSAPPSKAAAVAQSAPQTAQSTSETSQPAKSPVHADGPDAAVSADVATYGTRSRNRTGNARPNYAEDQEMDFEMTSTTATKKKLAADAGGATPQNSGDSKRARGDLQQLLTGSGTATPTSTNGVNGKESTPGAASNPSKKRKAAGPPTTLMQTPPVSNSTAPSASRKVAASSATARETNVVTFSKHKACLNKKGELVADDGMKLSVNGKPGQISSRIFP